MIDDTDTDTGFELDAELEERLRRHYRHLRTQPQAPRSERPRPMMLTAAACLATAVALGGVYLAMRNADQGQPLQTGPGLQGDDVIEQVEERSASTIDVDTPSTADLDRSAPPTADPAQPPQLTDGQSSDGSDTQPSSNDDRGSEAGVGTTTEAGAPTATDPNHNADGSRKAPTPGTVAPPADAERSAAHGLWEPGPHDSCSTAIHDSYWVYGPDGKVYPTYHPPVDPATGCTFGHEHGRDPAGSDLADIPFPFGYVEELAMVSGVGPASDDHVGHKIEWYNDGGYYQNGSSTDDHDQICDVAYKLHMGTHSDDAFADNTHEVFHYARCENGSELIYRAMQSFGGHGQFNMHCDQRAGSAVVVGQTNDQTNERVDHFVGAREIPASQCFEDRVLVSEGQRSDWSPFDERWALYQSVDSADFGRFFIQFYFFADVPSRYWDGEKLARTVDLCYITGALQVRDDEYCEPMLAANTGTRIRWDDPASPRAGTGDEPPDCEGWRPAGRRCRGRSSPGDDGGARHSARSSCRRCPPQQTRACSR